MDYLWVSKQNFYVNYTLKNEEKDWTFCNCDSISIFWLTVFNIAPPYHSLWWKTFFFIIRLFLIIVTEMFDLMMTILYRGFLQKTGGDWWRDMSTGHLGHSRSRRVQVSAHWKVERHNSLIRGRQKKKPVVKGSQK